MKLKLILFFIFLFIAKELIPQSTNSVEYLSGPVSERILLYNNRGTYLSGETIPFSLFCFEKSLYIPFSLSKIAYVELYNQNNVPLVQTKVELINGFGSGTIEIPKKSKTDYYFIRAYTQYMKNEGPSVFATKRLQIINPFLSSENHNYEITENQFDIMIFPESGKLFPDVSNNITFLINGINDSHNQLKLSLISHQNDTLIQSVKIHESGLGFFSFIPKKNETYSLVLTDKNKIITSPLPDTDDSGVYMKVDCTNDHAFSIFIKSIDQSNHPWFIQAENNKLRTVIKNDIRDTETLFSISFRDLPAGLVKMKLLNNEGNVLNERWVFVPFPETLDIQMNTVQNSFEKRQLVRLDLQSNINGKPVESNIMVSGFTELDTASSLAESSLYKNIFIDEFCNQLQIFNQCQIEKLMDDEYLLHALLLAYDKENKKRNNNNKFFPETEGDIISGRLLEAKTKKPVSNIKIYQSFVDTISKIEATISDSSGNFQFIISRGNSCTNLILYVLDTLNKYQVELDPEFYPEFTDIIPEVFIPDKRYQETIKKAKINTQVSDAFRDVLLNNGWINNTYPMYDFYGIPTRKYETKDYVNLPNMEEFIIEIVHGIRIQKKKKKVDFRVVEKDGIAYKVDPLILFDGVPYYNASNILQLKPEYIKSVSLVENIYFYKGQIFFGIIDIKSKSGDFSLLSWPENSFNFDYSCVQSGTSFCYNENMISNQKIPLYNNLFYFNPDIRTNNEGKTRVAFFTGDNSGSYIISGFGYTESGALGSFQKRIIVE